MIKWAKITPFFLPQIAWRKWTNSPGVKTDLYGKTLDFLSLC